MYIDQYNSLPPYNQVFPYSNLKEESLDSLPLTKEMRNFWFKEKNKLIFMIKYLYMEISPKRNDSSQVFDLFYKTISLDKLNQIYLKGGAKF